MDEIREFRGQYRWLSNFWPAAVELDGVVYPTVEHAYQASKTIIHKERMLIYECHTPGDAKRMSRELTLRPHWEQIKPLVMYDLVHQKFFRYLNFGLSQKLLQTGDCRIVEGNYWHDNYWGQCYCERCQNKPHRNQLGVILMEIRNEIWELQGE